MPIIKDLGFVPLWFGVIFNVSLQLAYLPIWPFMGMQLIGLIPCIVVPEICVWLPNLLIK